MCCKKYVNLFERLVANTRLAVEGDAGSCWLWTGRVSGRYGRLNVWRDGRLVTVKPHRAMLEEFYDIEFPHDEAGHLCHNTLCINPSHLEVQTQAHNLSERRGHGVVKGDGCWIPVLYPRAGLTLQAAADAAWDAAPGSGDDCFYDEMEA